MTDETLKIILALGVPAASAIGGFAARGLVSFGKHLFDDAVDARIKAQEFKAKWKDSVIAQRDMRRAEEVLLAGKPSVPPISIEEETGQFYVDEAADQEWRRRSEERRVQLRREQELSHEQRNELERYNRDMPSPDPTKPLPRPPRPYRK